MSNDRETCPHCGGDVVAGTTCPKSLTCPKCTAKPGARCQRPSGHLAPELHTARVDAAEDIDRAAGVLGSC